MENPRSKMYYFEKLMQFSQGNNVLDDAASNIDCFLWRNTCVSSTELTGIFGAKRDHLILKCLSERKHCIQKLTQNSQRINVLNAPTSTTDGFLGEIHMFLPFH
jgi:hypothetical protein